MRSPIFGEILVGAAIPVARLNCTLPQGFELRLNVFWHDKVDGVFENNVFGAVAENRFGGPVPVGDQLRLHVPLDDRQGRVLDVQRDAALALK